MTPLLSHLIAFLIGALTGAAGSYLGSKFTDQRHKQEGTRAATQAFGRVRDLMPDLISELAKDLREPGNSTIHEFFVAPSRQVIISSSQPRLIFYESEHEDLRGKVTILANHSYVIDVTPGNIPVYRLTEAFVAHLLGA